MWKYFKSDNTHHDGEDVETLPLSILVLILIIQTKYYTCDKHSKYSYKQHCSQNANIFANVEIAKNKLCQLSQLSEIPYWRFYFKGETHISTLKSMNEMPFLF